MEVSALCDIGQMTYIVCGFTLFIFKVGLKIDPTSQGSLKIKLSKSMPSIAPARGNVHKVIIHLIGAQTRAMETDSQCIQR